MKSKKGTENKVKVSQRISLRKSPIQDRASNTITYILDAASRIIEEKGFDQFTTGNIAEHANLSSGAMYRYFPNKESILYSLAERRWKEFRAIHEECTPGKYDSWVVWQNVLIDQVAQKYISEPGLASYIDVIATLPEIRELHTSYNQEVLAYLQKAYKHFNPRMRQKEKYMLAETMNVIITSLLARSVQLSKPEQIIMQNKIKSILYVLSIPYFDGTV